MAVEGTHDSETKCVKISETKEIQRWESSCYNLVLRSIRYRRNHFTSNITQYIYMQLHTVPLLKRKYEKELGICPKELTMKIFFVITLENNFILLQTGLCL